MVQKQSIYGRMAQLSMTNLDAIIDRSAEPLSCIQELISSFSEVISQAETLIEQRVGRLRLSEADHAEDVAASVEWEQEVRLTRELAQRAHSSANTTEAQQLKALSTYAAGKQASFEACARQAAPHIAAQSARIKELRATLAKLESQRETLTTRQREVEELMVTIDSAKRTTQTTTINVFDPTAELSRFRERVNEIESNMG